MITSPALTVHNWLKSDSNGGKNYIPAKLVDRKDPKTWKKLFMLFLDRVALSVLGILLKIENSCHENRSSNQAK